MSYLQGSTNYVWSLGDILGQGATGGVYKGRNKKTGDLCAVKTFNDMGYMRPVQVQIREFDIIQKLKHKNIVKLIGIEEELSTKANVIIMELCTGGSLLNILDDPENAFGLPDCEFLIVLHDVADGMKYLKDQGFVHRDVKPGNIMKCISDDGRSVYKLTDFGAARQLEDGDQFVSLYGTEEYLYPDIYERAVLQKPSYKQYDASVDLWSLGVTFYHAAAGQLPFRPFGGRKNKETMYYITTKKESGVISGVQYTEEGSIEWSRELPKNSRLSVGARKLVTPLLAGLMETDPAKMWTHDKFFEEVLKIRRKTVLYVFSFPSNSVLSVYVDTNARLAQVQALITEQTDLHANKQDLTLCQMPLSSIVDPMQEVRAYPETSPRKPITLYSTTNAEFPHLSPVECPAFPRFSSTSLSLDTDSWAATCSCATLYLFKRFIEDFTLRKELLTAAIWQYMIILAQDIDHVMYYMSLFEKTCEETRRCLSYLADSHSINMKLMSIASNDNSLKSLQDWSTHLQPLNNDVHNILQTLADSQIKMSSLQKRVIQRRNFLTSWQETQPVDNNGVAKIKVALEAVKEIRIAFKKDKSKKRLSFNDEQIHKFERMKVTEMCTRGLSLLDHCYEDLRQHYTKIQEWYNIVCPIRQQLSKLERDVANLIERQKAISGSLNKEWGLYQQSLRVWIRTALRQDLEQDSLPIPPDIPAVVESTNNLSPLISSVDPVSPSKGNSLSDPQSMKSSGSDRDKAFKKELISKLQENLKSLGDETHYVRNAIQEGADLIKQFEEALSSQRLDMTIQANGTSPTKGSLAER